MTPAITLYYDVISPWSLFALKMLQRYQPVWGFTLTFKPRYLGGVMAASGNKPPATLPNKGLYMRNFDMPLTSAYYGVPYKYPKVFPVNTIHIARFLRIVEDLQPSKLEPLTVLFFEGMWGLSADAPFTADPQNFGTIIPPEVLSRSDIAKYIQLSGSTENKDRMKAEATALVEQGAFGFPWMTVTNDAGKTINIFGSDRFELISYHLGKTWLGPFPEGGRPSKL
ncbi:hypothetical protein RQP46_009365 [Phenoliferia psychrophenolica]